MQLQISRAQMQQPTKGVPSAGNNPTAWEWEPGCSLSSRAQSKPARVQKERAAEGETEDLRPPRNPFVEGTEILRKVLFKGLLLKIWKKGWGLPSVKRDICFHSGR